MRSAPGYFLWKQVGLAWKIYRTVAATEALFTGPICTSLPEARSPDTKAYDCGVPSLPVTLWVPFPSCEVPSSHTCQLVGVPKRVL